MHIVKLLDAGESAYSGAVFHDALRQNFADARQRLEFVGGCGV